MEILINKINFYPQKKFRCGKDQFVKKEEKVSFKENNKRKRR